MDTTTKLWRFSKRNLGVFKSLLSADFIRHSARLSGSALQLIDPQLVNLDRAEIDKDVLLQDLFDDGTQHVPELTDTVSLSRQLDDEFDDQRVARWNVAQRVDFEVDFLLQGAAEQLQQQELFPHVGAVVVEREHHRLRQLLRLQEQQFGQVTRLRLQQVEQVLVRFQFVAAILR